VGASAAISYIHVDHLNTPRLVANAAGQTVWLWHQAEPFGNSVPDENPSGLGAFDLPLRLPGQRYDAETGLHYNYYRDYDPSIGRYGESDPIGLMAGLNTYAYVLGSPLHLTDRYGLASDAVARGPWWPEKPTSDQVQKAIKDAIKKGRICLKPGEDCSKLHEAIYKLCTGLFANYVLCRLNADEVAGSCVLNPDLYRCPEGSVACLMPSVSQTSMDAN
jgi:RHS repeat-associated protein